MNNVSNILSLLLIYRLHFLFGSHDREISLCELYFVTCRQIYKELEALGERRPPWQRQIITPIFPNVIMLSLGGERLTPKVLDHYLHHDLGMLPLFGVCLLFYSS